MKKLQAKVEELLKDFEKVSPAPWENRREELQQFATQLKFAASLLKEWLDPPTKANGFRNPHAAKKALERRTQEWLKKWE